MAALATSAVAADNAPICGDLNDTGNVSSTDALLLLRYAVGQPVSLACPDYLERYGFDADRGFTANWSEDYLFGTRVSVAKAATVTHLGLFSRDAGTHVKIALYSDDAGAPDALVARTPSTEVSIGANEVPVVESKPLAPGFYWVMIVADVAIDIAANDNTTEDNILVYRDLPFADEIPATFGAGTTYPSNTADFWMRVIQ